MKRPGVCRNCGSRIEEWEVLNLASYKGNPSVEITRRKINLQLKIYKGDIYQQTIRLCSVACLETWTALSLPKFVQVAQAVSA